MERPDVGTVLAEIAAIASETLELQSVFDRVAASVRTLVPFDEMGVVRLLDGGRAVIHATTLECPHEDGRCSQPTPLTAWSPRIRPGPEPIPLVHDAELELDASFQVDAGILEKGARSSLWEPFRAPDAGFTGGIWLSSRVPRAFDEHHQEMLTPIAAILGLAVEHWRIWDAERRRRERLSRLEAILASVPPSLDVREVFTAVSDVVQPVLPHDTLVLTRIDDRHRSFRVLATAGPVAIPVPEGDVPLNDVELAASLRDFEIARDVQTEVDPRSARGRALLDCGMRSWLRVPVLLSGEVHGSLGFLHRESDRFEEDDVEIARCLADRLALAISHKRLAEEARLAAEASERAERLAATVETLTRELEQRGRFKIVGSSASWRAVVEQVGRVAPVDTTVLLTGESGTGKEVLARMIHQGSPRAERPFVAINCAALPEQLLESELFGHEKGAFTGAVATRPGRVEQASGGTLFLDEIGEMSPLVQAKLLRVLQEREFQRVGGTRTQRADVRVVAATNRDLAEAIAAGQFREDLYYRLNVFQISVPPLRDRPEDILLLAETFLEDLGRSLGRGAAGISRDARDGLLAYPWPGNVRELRNAMERALLLCDGGLVTREHLPAAVGTPSPPRTVGQAGVDLDAPLPPGGLDLDDLERSYVEKALREARGNKAKASRLLGLTRAQLYSRIEKYGLG